VEASAEILAGDPAPRLEDVALTVGASRASLYYYFAGRDDLLTFLLTSHAREGADRALARADESDPPPLRLRAMLAALVEYLGAHPGVCTGMLAAAGGGTKMAEVLAVNDSWIAAPLRAVVAEGVESGALAVGTSGDPSAVADAVNAILGGLLFGVLGRASSGGEPADDEFQQRLVDQVVRGLTAPG
jgi:AcrR family transcriptional regulator